MRCTLAGVTSDGVERDTYPSSRSFVFDRVNGRTDANAKLETFGYDSNGNVVQHIDRRGQVMSRSYDSLDRLHQIMNADGSTITYGYDGADRITSITDSATGLITRGFDGLDRLTSESTPQGSVTYTYDTANRRQTMTVAGQPTITYGYDDANRLTSVTQGSTIVAITYDDANRRTGLAFPNGASVQYGYDAASQLVQLTYSIGQTTLGTLNYTYDTVGRRIEVSGARARTLLPQSVAASTYDPANRLTQWGSHTLNYDANGNLTGDGLNSYGWNARDQLIGLSGGLAATFQYDSFGRRIAKTVSGVSTSYLYQDREPCRPQAMQAERTTTPGCFSIAPATTPRGWADSSQKTLWTS